MRDVTKLNEENCPLGENILKLASGNGIGVILHDVLLKAVPNMLN